ncbi:MAG TPA: Ni/Fe hydrogenase subunit alpha [Caldisericia bacterium]|nr:Ni/Fe hydrogenase subunit alpha [Caldisericia bacterium]HPF48803.1 Ni/Fe hydrogenase subunit alpha [Caldisericia bacterium]HPI84273.1 Ni/Fe hydrogenase subunit alpha [Caldisericia bacterium]HPQ93451.1 Ni/Fe hydrogenase subunit alpha [Caldisericia bacterium]HRV74909.1 Ni/Fe hydrogenase subunit alpha [Caldisericia bacterium]
MSDINIHVHHVTRVEGHGDVLLNVKDGKVEHVSLNIVEAPRFFEGMLKGRSHYEAREITTRICGICACGHALASLRASEAAMSIEPSEQTINLRKLVLHGENLSSHFLHIFFLVAPDAFGVPSVLPLAKTHTDLVVRALKLKKLGNDVSEVIVGRHVHPITLHINGLSKLPDPAALKDIQRRCLEAIPEVEDTVNLFSTLSLPDFTRETEYVSLGPRNGSKEYPFYDGVVKSSEGVEYAPQDYQKVTNEYIMERNTAKHTKHKRSSYMVGALARFNNNYDLLRPEAKAAAEKLGLKAPNHNPYMITVAQLVETIHILHDTVELIQKVLDRGIKEESNEYKVRAGQGVGAVEVPRGILFHNYTYDNKGVIQAADLVIPTTQNLENIDQDMRKLAPEILDQPKEKIELLLQMLVRAYDPCISCSTHLLKVRFTK